MSISFSGSELINIAINIEKSGIAFYDTMSRSTENPTVGAIFRNLTAMERQHVKIFEEMLAKTGQTKPANSGDEEYRGYLEALVNNAVFSDELIAGEMANRVNSDIEALELGIEAEKDSILFYYEMRETMPQPSVINQVISEEKSHLGQLTELKKKLSRHK
jgi:rubrerythrin